MPPAEAAAALASMTDCGMSLGPWNAPHTYTPFAGGGHRVEEDVVSAKLSSFRPIPSRSASSYQFGGCFQPDGQHHQVEVPAKRAALGHIGDSQIVGVFGWFDGMDADRTNRTPCSS